MTHAETVVALVRAASEYTGLDGAAIIGKSRRVDLAECRWACWRVLRAKGWPLQAIGRVFERDHGAVIHGLKRAKDHHGQREEYFREVCQFVEAAIGKEYEQLKK